MSNLFDMRLNRHRTKIAEKLPDYPDEIDLQDVYLDTLIDIREEIRDSNVFSPEHMVVFIYHINELLERISKYMPD